MTPAMSCFRGSSFLVSDKYGQTCAEESRSHMASMSPVITNVSGFPSTIRNWTVVSNVFGKQFSNIQAILGSFILAFTLTIVLSTAVDMKCRSPGAGRLDTYACCRAPVTDDTAMEG